MRTVIVYESMFGNTRLIAQAIAKGLDAQDVRVLGVTEADETALHDVDLVVVGGPTQAWSMSRPSTRRGAPLYVRKPDSGLVLEPNADTGPGVREWLGTVGRINAQAAAFDTRIASPVLFTGRASKAVARHLRRHGFTVILPPESFLVDKKSHLLSGELERACAWGKRIAETIEHAPSDRM
jgi:hypothetical protein